MQQIKATFLEGYHSAPLFCLTWFSAIHSFEVFLVSPICFIFQGQVTLHITSHNFHFLEGFVSSFKFSDKDFGNITSKTFLLATRLRGSDKTFSSGMNNFYFSILLLFFLMFLKLNKQGIPSTVLFLKFY